jgi:DNA-binding transcriptional regulator YiaG
MMKFKELRQQSGMNLKQFSEYFEIPYRTAQNWDSEVRHCPEYLLKLMQYKLQNEKKGEQV